jgi:hypothetical protein
VKPDSFRPWLVEEESSGSFDYVVPQLLPGIPFREDVLRQTFGTIAAIGLLEYLEY